MNKRGVEINVATIIVVILAILVLVILALYFTGGMKNLWGKITPVPSAYEKTDVEHAQSACTLYCNSQDKNAFCSHEFNLRKQKTTETEVKKCWESPISAQKLDDCKAVGFTSDICQETTPT